MTPEPTPEEYIAFLEWLVKHTDFRTNGSDFMVHGMTWRMLIVRLVDEYPDEWIKFKAARRLTGDNKGD